MKSKITTAIFPVAGLGLRALPGSKAIPKHFHSVAGQPVIHYAVREAKQAGIKKFIFIVGTDPLEKELLKRQFLDFKKTYELLHANDKEEFMPIMQDMDISHLDVSFVEQKDALGLGHAIYQARNLIEREDNFAVLCPDDLILPTEGGLSGMVKNINSQKAYVGLEEVHQSELNKFGIVNMNEDGTILNIVEKPSDVSLAPSRLAITGRYILTASAFDMLAENIDAFHHKTHTYHEVGMTEILNQYAEMGLLNGKPIDGKRFDCGNRIGLIEANFHAAMYDMEIAADLLKKFSKNPLPPYKSDLNNV